MPTIADAVQSFLREMEWHWEQLDEHRLRVLVSGETGRWVWMATWNEKDTLFLSYSICQFNVPNNRRLAVAEFLTLANYGLSLGNFELDFRDGEVRFKNSIAVKKDRLSRAMVRELAFCGFSIMDHYLPALMSVAFGKLSPRKAIEQADAPAREEPADDPDAEPDPADDPATRERVTALIADYLCRMKDRANNEARSHCFIVFSDQASGRKARRKQGTFGKQQPLRRMIQLCFHEDWFAVDIPNTNILPREAERLVQERPGFYREAEKPDADVSNVVQIVEFDPVGKRYDYGQEQEAADDAVWILFDLWGLRPGQPLYVSASSFKTDHRWEQNELLK
ncbi:MAG: hypothetical protein BIFFINMI_00595 [Phycisphaerae bacterium]|nr:hypothetical protein [Phycisphaerae bacterium]